MGRGTEKDSVAESLCCPGCGAAGAGRSATAARAAYDLPSPQLRPLAAYLTAADRALLASAALGVALGGAPARQAVTGWGWGYENGL